MKNNTIFQREGRKINVILPNFSTGTLKFKTLIESKDASKRIHANMRHMASKDSVTRFLKSLNIKF